MTEPRQLRGRLQRTDLGSGGWTLHADDGTTWVLEGTIDARLEGDTVILDGHPVQSFGFMMAGPVFKVRRARRA